VKKASANRPADPHQDRDQQILSRLAKIQHKVDSLEQTTAFALRADSGRHFATAKAIFKNSKRRAQVYLAADGQRSVQEIAAHLSMQRQNVGPDLKILGEEGLLEIVDEVGGRDVWAKTAIDKSLRISKFLTTEYRLADDGRTLSKGEKARAGKPKRHAGRKARRRGR
jgi:DNA-binding transcriptional ArsR family regulator